MNLCAHAAILNIKNDMTIVSDPGTETKSLIIQKGKEIAFFGMHIQDMSGNLWMCSMKIPPGPPLKKGGVGIHTFIW
jgi:hypothetical protein